MARPLLIVRTSVLRRIASTLYTLNSRVYEYILFNIYGPTVNRFISLNIHPNSQSCSSFQSLVLILSYAKAKSCSEEMAFSKLNASSPMV